MQGRSDYCGVGFERCSLIPDNCATCDACVVDVALDRRSPRRSIWDADPRAGMQHGLLLSKGVPIAAMIELFPITAAFLMRP